MVVLLGGSPIKVSYMLSFDASESLFLFGWVVGYLIVEYI